MEKFWDERYAETDFAYGKNPNEFLVENITNFPKGKILFAAEGEGRNSVFAASQGFEVYAFDYSKSGQEKAMTLAQEKNTTIYYTVSDVLQLSYEANSFDTLVLIFAHFPAAIRKMAHQKLLTYVKTGGKVVFEAFAKEQLNYFSGGPKDLSMLFSEAEVKNEFIGIDFDFLKTEIIDLNEGPHHQGKGIVVRFIGTKK